MTLVPDGKFRLKKYAEEYSGEAIEKSVREKLTRLRLKSQEVLFEKESFSGLFFYWSEKFFHII